MQMPALFRGKFAKLLDRFSPRPPGREFGVYKFSSREVPKNWVYDRFRGKFRRRNRLRSRFGGSNEASAYCPRSN